LIGRRLIFIRKIESKEADGKDVIRLSASEMTGWPDGKTHPGGETFGLPPDANREIVLAICLIELSTHSL